ncbi:Uncharacterised protein [Bordetella pertussis]|nr:Uncharacterised protein [Bordetella pertussis]
MAAAEARSSGKSARLRASARRSAPKWRRSAPKWRRNNRRRIRRNCSRQCGQVPALSRQNAASGAAPRASCSQAEASFMKS